jgi:hypothetical protein
LLAGSAEAAVVAEAAVELPVVAFVPDETTFADADVAFPGADAAFEEGFAV